MLYFRPMPWYISFPISVVLFVPLCLLLSGYLPEKHPGLDWSRVLFAMGVQLIVVTIMLPINYWYNTHKLRQR